MAGNGKAWEDGGDGEGAMSPMWLSPCRPREARTVSGSFSGVITIPALVLTRAAHVRRRVAAWRRSAAATVAQSLADLERS